LRVTAVCASALPSSVAPASSTIAVRWFVKFRFAESRVNPGARMRLAAWASSSRHLALRFRAEDTSSLDERRTPFQDGVGRRGSRSAILRLLKETDGLIGGLKRLGMSSKRRPEAVEKVERSRNDLKNDLRSGFDDVGVMLEEELRPGECKSASARCSRSGSRRYGMSSSGCF
jgi:hypothetical protein